MPSPRPRLSPRRKAAHALAACLAFFALAEGGLRAASLGVRTLVRARTDADAPIGASERTLLAAGDSVTYGMPYGPEQGWPKALGARLASSGIAVHNLGRPGAGFRDALGGAEAALQRSVGKRAAVFLLAGHNDCSYLGGLGMAREPGVAASLPVRSWLNASVTWRLLVQGVVRLTDVPWQRGIPVYPRADELRACFDAVDAGLEEARRTAERHDVEISVLTYPVAARWYGDPVAGPFSHSQVVDDHLVTRAAALGLPVLDVRECMVLAERARGSFFPHPGVHMTAEGYSALGACAASFAREARYEVVRR